eukprot:TRINITY_DN2117_c6_g1_i1.p1 TRINITY_DN2117_c6_g1~~TRINITY_DN2117_c6_g1_i1.p1  ORF type:complete len:146 (+),score=1.44 TRINITY_DN2117_c6_g1_i1:84-521(+)
MPSYTPPSVVAISIIGRHGSPIFLDLFEELDEEESLWLQCSLASSLDPIEDKVKQAKGDNRYLGFVFPSGDCRVYATTSNTLVKLLAVLKGEPRDADVRNLLRLTHEAYSAQVCNPFYEYSTPITSQKFRNGIRKIVADTKLKPA